MRGPKRSSGERSSAYSRSKFSNWTPFDPFWSEAEAARKLKRPEDIFEVPMHRIHLPVYSMELHPEFLRPCSVSDVCEVLHTVPCEFLTGLEGIYLLGGSKKQISASRLFRYGSYSPGCIYLYAYPCCMLERRLRRASKPSVRRRYERSGVEVTEAGGHWFVHFNRASLRRFYLYDVLLHELAHHIDERAFTRPRDAAEKFAEWFAQEQARHRSN